jgi:hypothetical protein
MLTTCALSQPVSCSSPHVGFQSDPGLDLRLDRVMPDGGYPEAYLNAVAAYQRLSGYLGGGSVVCILVLAISGVLGSYVTRKLIICATLLSALATALLFGTVVAVGITFKALANAINAEFSDEGVTAVTGATALGLSSAVVVLSGLSTLVLALRACNAPRKAPSHSPPAREGKASRVKGFLAGFPSTGRHARYMEIRKQPPLTVAGVISAGQKEKEATHTDSEEENLQRRFDTRLDDDWAVEDEYAAGGSGVAMRSLAGGKSRTLDVDTAYEPYASTTN